MRVAFPNNAVSLSRIIHRRCCHTDTLADINTQDRQTHFKLTVKQTHRTLALWASSNLKKNSILRNPDLNASGQKCFDLVCEDWKSARAPTHTHTQAHIHNKNNRDMYYSREIKLFYEDASKVSKSSSVAL